MAWKPRLYILLLLIGGGGTIFMVRYPMLVTRESSSLVMIATDFSLVSNVHIGNGIATGALDNSTHVDARKNPTRDNEDSGEIDNLTFVQPSHNFTRNKRIKKRTFMKDSAAAKHSVTYFSMERKDRDGSAVQDMLVAHAYAFFLNGTYGGACVVPGINNNPRTQDEHKLIVKKVGLDTILPFACPTTTMTTPENRTDDHYQLLAPEAYLPYDPTRFTEAWWQSIQSKINYSNHKDDVYRVAVHIRRQDVEPCGKYHFRYLSNEYYLALLKRYVPPRDEMDKNVEITIFSQKKSFESMDIFRDLNFSVLLNTDVADAWRSMMVADLLIMSKSSFSYVPALFNRQGRVIYTPFWHKPLSHWTVVDDDLVEREEQHLKKLIIERCPKE